MAQHVPLLQDNAFSLVDNVGDIETVMVEYLDRVLLTTLALSVLPQYSFLIPHLYISRLKTPAQCILLVIVQLQNKQLYKKFILKYFIC